MYNMSYFLVDWPQKIELAKDKQIGDYLYMIKPGADIDSIKKIIPFTPGVEMKSLQNIKNRPLTIRFNDKKQSYYYIYYSEIYTLSTERLHLYFDKNNIIVGFQYKGLIRFNRNKYLKILKKNNHLSENQIDKIDRLSWRPEKSFPIGTVICICVIVFYLVYFVIQRRNVSNNFIQENTKSSETNTPSPLPTKISKNEKTH